MTHRCVLHFYKNAGELSVTFNMEFPLRCFHFAYKKHILWMHVFWDNGAMHVWTDAGCVCACRCCVISWPRMESMTPMFWPSMEV